MIRALAEKNTSFCAACMSGEIGSVRVKPTFCNSHFCNRRRISAGRARCRKDPTRNRQGVKARISRSPKRSTALKQNHEYSISLHLIPTPALSHHISLQHLFRTASDSTWYVSVACTPPRAASIRGWSIPTQSNPEQRGVLQLVIEQEDRLLTMPYFISIDTRNAH